MKKYLAMFLTLMMIFSLVSCGDTRESSSEPSSSVSESSTEEVTTEEPTEPATEEPITEPETEPPTEEEITLNSEWKSDYLTIAKSSAWEETVEAEDDKINVNWLWEDETSRHVIDLKIETPSDNGKMSEEDLQKEYSKTELYTIIDSFTKNGQAYIITSMGEEDYIIRNIDFSTENIEGCLSYSTECEEIVMDMIDSIEFKEDIETTTETTAEEVTTTKATEPPTTPPTEPPAEKLTEPPTNPPIIVQEDSKTVYYTETGSKYHYDSKCGRGDYFPCTLDEALEMGLEPCKKCTEAN